MSNTVRPDDVEALIGRFQASGCAELHVRFEGFELFLSTDPATAVPGPAAAQAAARPATAPPRSPPAAIVAPAPIQDASGDLSGLEIIAAPYMGIFYRAPKPGEPSFVDIGSVVEPDTDLCLVEVMKLFTAVRAGISGTVARILAADGAMVEAGQMLFALQPKG